MSEPTKSKFFTYEDGEGHVYIVDSLEQIPNKYRELANEVKLGDRLREAKKLPKKSLKEAKKVQREVGDVVPFVNDLDLPSVAVGFAASLVVFLALAVVRKSLGLVLKLGLLLLIICLLGGAYFGWLRRASGMGDDALASPKTLIDDAKRAASDYQKKLDGQEKTLKKIEESAR
jgi:hypothetical protein